MPNNIFAGRPNLIIARANNSVPVSTVFDSTNISVIYEMGDIIKSYAPGRGVLNQFTNFTPEMPYYVTPKVSMDVSPYFIPPITFTATTIAPTTLPSTGTTTTIAPTTQNPNAPIRVATALDLQNIFNANPGDMIINGNDSGGTNILVRPDPPFANTQFTLDCSTSSKKILIKGGTYDIVEINVPGLTGTPSFPIIITNYGGQVHCKELRIKGINYWKVTGRYSAANKTGDPSFRGHDDLSGNKTAYAYSAGKYGFWIDNQWTDIERGLLSVSGYNSVQASNFEVEYIETGNGGFSNQFKFDSSLIPMVNANIHDMYCHDHHGEGIYIGSTGDDPQNPMINLHLHDMRILRSGNDGLQAGQLMGGCVIENNVVHGAMNWRSAFSDFQDNALQIGLRDGNIIVRNNIFVNCGEKFINCFTNAEGTSNGQLIDIYNNFFTFCRGPLGMYLGETSFLAGVPIRYRDNWFSKWNFMYNQIYTDPRGTNITSVVRTVEQNQITLQNNKWDGSGSKGTFVEHSPISNVTETNNIITTVPDLSFTDYMGFAPGFDYTLVDQWANKVFQTWGNEYIVQGSTQGTPVTYNPGQYVMHKSKLYKCLVTNSMVEPGAALNWQNQWQLMTFVNGATTPPDDVRVPTASQWNTLGMGLTSNLVAGATTTTSTTTTTIAPTTLNVQQNPDLNLVYNDNGDNSFTLKWERSRGQLTAGPKLAGAVIVAIGSSTFAGNGSSSTATSCIGLTATWLASVSANSILVNNGVASTDTRYAMPDGQYPQVTPHKNITAALSVSPTAVMIGFPTNDIADGIPPQTFASNIVTMYNLVRAQGAVCFVGSPQPRNTFSATEQQQLSDVNVSLKAAIPARFYIDVFDTLRDTTAPTAAVIATQYSAGDGVHVNDAGHQIIANKYINQIDSYFQDQANQGYEIESSLSSTSGFTLLTTQPQSSVPTAVIQRPDFQTHYYRVRIKYGVGNYSAYSNVLAVTQPIQVGALAKTYNFDFSPDTNLTTSAGWNTLTGPSVGPVTGSSYASIVDSTGASSTLNLTVTKGFSATGLGGSNNVPNYPTFASQDNWVVQNSQAAASEITITGLNQNVVYNAEILTSRATANVGWMLGSFCGTSEDGARVANSDQSANTTQLIKLNGLVPDNTGALVFSFRAMGAGYLSAMVLRQFGTSGSPTTTTTTSTTTTTTSTTTAPGATTTTVPPKTVQVNLFNGTASGLSGWNDWNTGAIEAYNLQLVNPLYSDGSTSAMTITLGGTYGIKDNGASYGNGQSLVYPQAVYRFASHMSATRNVTVTGLDNAKTYSLEFLSSRLSSAVDITKYTLGGVVQQVTTDNNYATTVIYNNISPSSGSIVVNVDKLGPNFNYINAFKIFEGGGGVTTTTTTGPATTTIPGQTTTTTTTTTSTTTTLAPGQVDQSFSTMTVSDSVNPQTWNVLVKKPTGYAGNSNTYPCIIYFVGLGEVGTNNASLLTNGPNKFINNGTWDGKVTVASTTYDPIIISMQPPSQWPNQGYARGAVNAVLAAYRVDPQRLYVTGISMGGWMSSGIIMNDSNLANKVSAYVNVEGVAPDDWGTSTSTPPYTTLQNYIKGSWLGFQQSNDYRQMDKMVATINAATANVGRSPAAAQYIQTAFSTGGHCCFDEFYDPTRRNYGALDGNADNIYQWMLRHTLIP